jgi:hypothetical protein
MDQHTLHGAPRTTQELMNSADEEPGSLAEDPLSPADEDDPPDATLARPAALERTPRPAAWAAIPDAQWDDWRWQLAHRLNTFEELSTLIHLTPEEIAGLTAKDKFRVDITPYFASLIDPHNPRCPIRRQVIPLGRELEAFDGMMADSLAEDAHSPVPSLVHRYPDRPSAAGPSGVAGLLRGDGLAIKPEGFDALHKRGAGRHRLNGDANKWKPYRANGNGE